jgi:hypothetical protein
VQTRNVEHLNPVLLKLGGAHRSGETLMVAGQNQITFCATRAETPWSCAFLQKLIVASIVKNFFFAFYLTRIFVTMISRIKLKSEVALQIKVRRMR